MQLRLDLRRRPRAVSGSHDRQDVLLQLPGLTPWTPLRHRTSTRIYYERPLHRHEALRAWRGAHALPHSEQLSDRSLALPLYPMLGDDEVDYVIRVVRQAAVEDADAGRRGDRCDFS